MIENIDIFLVSTVTLLFSTAFTLAKYNKYKVLFSELVDVIVSIRDAYEDDNISDDEVQEIIIEANKFVNKLKGMR